MSRRTTSQSVRKTAARISLVAVLLGASCTQNLDIFYAPPPQPKPVPPAVLVQPAQPRDTALKTGSAQNNPLVQYYENVQADFLRNELLRTDGGGADTPFTSLQLATNFSDIALNDEYTSVNGQFIAKTTPSALHRWDIPVRIALEFGPSIAAPQRTVDEATVGSLITRLAQATDHPITQVPAQSRSANFHVLVLNEAERRAISPRLKSLIPGIGPAALRSVEFMPRSSYCVVIASDPSNDGAYRNAVAIIRGEHPDLLRQSCFHEEIAQGLGLANDSPRARPSIFNDDEEFALLTRHDELLLRILYDPRLQHGMLPETARPISALIAQELLSDPFEIIGD